MAGASEETEGQWAASGRGTQWTGSSTEQSHSGSVRRCSGYGSFMGSGAGPVVGVFWSCSLAGVSAFWGACPVASSSAPSSSRRRPRSCPRPPNTMPLAIPNLNPARLRSYIFRLPLCTRVILFIIVALWAASILTPTLREKCALIPDQVSITAGESADDLLQIGPTQLRPLLIALLLAAFRLNTYPVTHVGLFHTLFNLLAITPLLERFEAEHGTLVSFALFSGRTFTVASPRPSICLPD